MIPFPDLAPKRPRPSMVGLGERLAKSKPSGPPTIEGIARDIAQDGFHARPHLDALAKLLEDAVEDVANDRRSRKIVVSMPPGQGKSQTASVALPIHMLANHPRWNIGVISSELTLATKFSRDARREAPMHNVKIAPDISAVTEWETTDGGGLIARGVGGSLTGRRLKALIMDDPIKDPRRAYSEKERKALWDWYQAVAKTRLAPVALSLCVMTRWHEEDIAASLIAAGWEEFRLPALAEDNDPIGRAPGEPLLTPQASETPEEALARWAQEREEVGEHVWAGLYQQRPAPAGGAIFNADHLIDAPDDLDLAIGTWITSWDLSFGGNGDYTVGTVWQRTPELYILHDVIRGRWEFTQQKAAILRTRARYPQCSRHLVEKAANGAAMVNVLHDDIPGITPIKPLGGKVERWQACTPLMEARKVATVGGAWLQDVVAEMAVAPNGAHDDILDSWAQGLNWLRLRIGGVIETGPPPTPARNPLRGVKF